MNFSEQFDGPDKPDDDNENHDSYLSAEFRYWASEFKDELEMHGLQWIQKGGGDSDQCQVRIKKESGFGRQFTGEGQGWKEAFEDAMDKYRKHLESRPKTISAKGLSSDEIERVQKGGEKEYRKIAYEKVRDAAKVSKFGEVETNFLKIFLNDLKEEDYEIAEKVDKELKSRK
ncbi:MAG: hypothetical protein WD335_02430 [Candidatus Paceibacterota bacterium]